MRLIATAVCLMGVAATASGDVRESAERAIRLIEATQLGQITYLNAQEAQKAAAMNDRVLSRPWELWVREVGPID